MKEKKNNKGFTLAELLIVCGIIAILLGIGIPIFIHQRHKSVTGVNLANIRSAKISALTGFYLDCIDGVNENDIFFYEYDVNTGKIKLLSPIGLNKMNFDGWAEYYSLGYKQAELAGEYKVCPKIYIYICMGKEMTVTNATAPWYDGDTLMSTENQPFGPERCL